MATYKEIHGTNIESLSSDPSNPLNGQMWYNSTTKELKGYTSNPAGSWASAPSINTARSNSGNCHIGTTTSSLIMGGGPPGQGITELYDGSSWTEVNNLNTVRYALGGIGASNTSALAIGGEDYPATYPYKANVESWNGTNWTEVNDLNTARQAMGTAGTVTSALAFGGEAPGDAHSAVTESWNGTNWTEVNDLNEGKRFVGGSGASNTAVLCFGGYTPPVTANVESWNGSNWTETTNMNTARYGLMGTGASSTSAIGAAGDTGSITTITETWDGSTWTEVGDMSTARKYMFGAGVQGAALSIGGAAPSSTASVEEFTSPITNTVTFTAS